jgi:hypothetical protein
MKQAPNTTKSALFNLIVLAACVVFLFTYCGESKGEPVPDWSCATGDMSGDYACMKKHWRPIKQVSADFTQEYCDTKHGKLYGNGYVKIYVDDQIMTLEINCPEVPKQ